MIQRHVPRARYDVEIVAIETAVEQILRTTAESPGEITIVAVGPLTNLGLALCLDPSLAQRVRSVSVMGGTVVHEGNASPSAEANIWHDPEAARIVDNVFERELPK